MLLLGIPVETYRFLASKMLTRMCCITELRFIDLMTNDLAIFERQLDLSSLEKELLKLDQVDVPTFHDFMGGVYLRTIAVRAGTLIIGKRHRHESCNMIISGEMSIYMGEDQPTKRISGPCVFKSEAGTKKMGYAHTDVVFVNIHPTRETDLEKIEAEFIIPEEEYLLSQSKNLDGGVLCLG